MTITIKNTEKIKARLDRIKARMLVSGDTDVLRVWGLSAEAIAKALVNVDTGLLRSRIAYRRISELEAAVGVTGVHYARPQEYGWMFSPGSAYIRPGADISMRECIARIKAYLASI